MRDNVLIEVIGVCRKHEYSDDEIKSLILQNFKISSDEAESYLL